MRLTCRLEFEKRLLNVLEVKSLCCEHGSLLPNWEHALVMAQCVARPSRTTKLVAHALPISQRGICQISGR